VTIEDDIAFLARVPTFAKFSFAALQIVAIGSEARNLADGETLFSAGETTDAGYLIQAGALTLAANNLTPSESDVRFGPGTLIGELALVTETVCSATAIATGPTTVIRISRNLFRKVLEGFPEAAMLTHERLLARVNQANGELVRIRSMLADGQARRQAGEKSPASDALSRNAAVNNSGRRNPGLSSAAATNPPREPRPGRSGR
jgi:CRP-like cAMP-binding protein